MFDNSELLLGILLFLLLLAAFFSIAETSMMSVNRYRIRHLAKHQHRAAKRVQSLLERPDRLLSVILIGSTFANILASAIATILVEKVGGELAVVAATIILTLIVLIFCEIAPKTLAALYSQRMAFVTSLPLQILLSLFYPVVWLANTAANRLLQLFRVNLNKSKLEHLSTEELRTIVHESSGHISTDHQDMLIRILDLEKITVNDIMVPRGDIAAIDIHDDWQKILSELTSSQYMRLPVFRDSIEHIEGIVNMRDVLRLLAERKLTAETLLNIIQPVYFIPENTLLTTQLLNFREEKARIGLVVDEYGDIQGLVTLEDILEEIIGEFTTNTESANKLILPQTDGSYIVDGSLSLREIKRLLGWGFSSQGPKTLSGIIIEYLQALPQPGTSLRLEGHPMEILKSKDNMVKLVRIWPKQEVNENA